MLRVTVCDNQKSLTFKLEGRSGAWVREVEECRQHTLAGRRNADVVFDLAGVTFMDAGGVAYLTAMHRQEAHFIAAGCLTKAIVAEITEGVGTASAKG